jgi:hypothetical protein
MYRTMPFAADQGGARLAAGGASPLSYCLGKPCAGRAAAAVQLRLRLSQ